jgi:hypothetical protein
MEIAGLRDRLVKIINDYLLQTSLSQGCCEVLKADVITLTKRLNATQKTARRIDPTTKDQVSQSSVLGSLKKKSLVVFMCHHAYYETDLVKLIAQQSMQRTQVAGQVQSQQLEQFQEKFRAQGYFCPVCRQNAENLSKPDRRRARK